MIKIELTQQERAELLTLHKKTRDKRICDRIKAVIHKSDGWTTRAIAKALLIHEDTVAQHLIDYQQDKLKPANGGSVKKLEEQQEKELVVHLYPTQFKTRVYLRAQVKPENYQQNAWTG